MWQFVKMVTFIQEFKYSPESRVVALYFVRVEFQDQRSGWWIVRLLDHGDVATYLVVVNVALVDLGPWQIQKESQEVCAPGGKYE